MDEMELRTAGQTFLVGEDLYAVSVDQLNTRIIILEAELVRLSTAVGKKSEELSAAESFFKNP